MTRRLISPRLKSITVCGTQKKIYLGDSDAAKLNETFAKITNILNNALVAAGSHLADIECN
jgi:hypothetical protein